MFVDIMVGILFIMGVLIMIPLIVVLYSLAWQDIRNIKK